MCYKKHIGRTVVILGVLAFFFSCKKLDKGNPIEFKIKAHIPYSDEPISGVKYTIREYKIKNGDSEYTDFELTGSTDLNGDAIISFAPRKSKSYYYDLTFDYSSLQFANYSGSYSLINAPYYVHLVRNNQQDFEIRALPQMNMKWNFKNLSCIDSNDSFKYRQYNYDERPFHTFNPGDPWLEGPSLNGCVNIEGDYIMRYAGRYIFIWQATRGGITTTGTDTFFVSPGGVDYVNMYW